MLFAAFLACVGVVKADDLVVGQRYRLKNVASGLYMHSTGLNKNQQLQPEEYSTAQFYYLENAEEGQYYLKTTFDGATRYVNANSWDSQVSDGKNTPYTIALVDGETDVYTISQTVSDYKGYIGVDAGAVAGNLLYCNKGAGAVSQWKFETVDYPKTCTFDPTKTYRIKSEFSGLYMELADAKQTSGEGAFQLKNKSTNAGQKFKFEAVADTTCYYLKTVDGEATYYVNIDSWNFYAGADPNTPFTIALVGDETAVYSLYQGVGKYKGYAGNNKNATDGTFIYNNVGNLSGNTIWSFEEVADVIVDVTYIYVCDNTELKRETVKALVGAPYVYNLPWGYTTDLKGTITKAEDITVNCTVDLPFEYAASVEDITKWYYVQLKSNDKKYIQYLDGKDYIEWADATMTEGETFSYLWAFVGNMKDGFKMVNNAAGITMGVKSTGSGNPVLADIKEATAWIPAQSRVSGDQYFCLQHSNKQYMNGQSGKIAHWGSNDEGSTFNVVAAANYTVNYKYTYKLNEVVHEIGNAKFENLCLGSAYPVPSVPYGYSAETPAGKVFRDTTITIACTENLPFEYAATVETIENWYYMQMHSNTKKYVKRVESALSWEDAQVDEANKGSYAWAFVGDPINGFKVVNYAAGIQYALLSTGKNGDAVTLTEIANATALFVKPSNQNKVDFCLKPADGNYMNAQGTTLKHWGDPDAGSTIKVSEVAMTLDRVLSMLVEEYEAKEIEGGVNPGEYSAATVNALNAAIATAKAVKNATAADTAALNKAYRALSINPVVAGLYRIVSAFTGFNEEKGISAYAQDNYYRKHNYPAWAPVNVNDPLQYWTLESNGDGTFNIKAAYEGNYITTATSLSASKKAATFKSLGKGQFNITLAGDDKPLHCNGWNWGSPAAPLTIWDGGIDSNSAWKLIAVTETPEFTFDLTVGAMGYATLMLGYNAEIPEGVACYTVTVDGAVAHLKAIQGDVLPANTPVIVEAEAKMYTFASTEETATIAAANALKGTLYPSVVTPAANTVCYVLAKPGENPVGFYKAALNQNDKKGFLNNANKAYVAVEVAQGQSAPALAIRKGEGTTAIDNAQLTIDNEATVIYDLLGRRVEKMEKGIYIVNGRKVLVK